MPQVVDKKNISSSILEEKIKILMAKEDITSKENESFETRWEKAIPAEKVFDKLEKKVKDLWQK